MGFKGSVSSFEASNSKHEADLEHPDSSNHPHASGKEGGNVSTSGEALDRNLLRFRV